MTSHLEVPLKNGMIVVIPDATYRRILPYQQTTGPETGGVILGFFSHSNRIVLQRFMPPSPRNRAGKKWLKRDLMAAQKFVDESFVRTVGKLNYVGEWHTHPEPDPIPSRLDNTMLGDMLRNSRLEIDFIVGVILGTTGKLCIWAQTAKKLLGREPIIPQDGAIVPEFLDNV